MQPVRYCHSSYNRLHMSVRTVERHRGAVMKAIGVHSFARLVQAIGVLNELNMLPFDETN